MNEYLYFIDSITIAITALILLILCMESGYRLGKRVYRRGRPANIPQVLRIEASMLGLITLLIGFTFSLSLQRYQERTKAVVTEAKTIGTAYLRADLLPAQYRDSVKVLLRQYLDLRVRESTVSIADDASRQQIVLQTKNVSSRLWTFAVRSVETDASPAKAGAFVISLNEMFDGYDQSEADLNVHVPETVIDLLFLAFILTAGIFGYTSGTEGHRPTIPANIFLAMIILFTFLIIDLDRPRRGLIRVSRESLVSLQQTMPAN